VERGLECECFVHAISNLLCECEQEGDLRGLAEQVISLYVIAGTPSLYSLRHHSRLLRIHSATQLHCETKSSHFSLVLGSASKQLINSSTNSYLRVSRRTNRIRSVAIE
jgi:hypothetical protein